MDEYNEKRTDAEERPVLARTWKKLRRYAVIGVLILMVTVLQPPYTGHILWIIGYSHITAR